MQDELQSILEEFFIEAEENLDQIEADLMTLEANVANGAYDGDVVDRLFRMLHTLKGGAGFLGLEQMAKLAHSGENLLDEVRAERVVANTDVVNTLLSTNDTLRTLLNHYRNDEDTSGINTVDLVAKLDELVAGASHTPPASAAAAPAAPAAPEDTAAAPVESSDNSDTETTAIDESLINQDLLAEVMSDDTLNPENDPDAEATPAATEPADPQVNAELLAEVINDDGLSPDKDPDAAAAPDTPSTPASSETVLTDEELAETPAATTAPGVNEDLLNEVLNDDTLNPENDPENAGSTAPATPSAAPATTSEEPAQSAPAPAPEVTAETAADAPAPEIKRGEKPAGSSGAKASSRSPVSNETIRVEIHRLDKVMNLVGELVLARNGAASRLLKADVRDALKDIPEVDQIWANVEQLSRITQDLQMSVLSTRMQPIKKVFDKIPRQVRELKNQLGKEVDLVVEGEFTEVDKSLVEELSDPMVHMVRNALDHGIETPEERKAASKHPTGTLFVRAFYEGNNVVIQVEEDGKGIDPNKIKRLSVQKGLISEQQAASLSDEEAVRLVLAPGFSTADKISDVSGRGVGMDVVNSTISEMKGTLDIKSELGIGTTFSIYLPLTLAIVQALVVSSNNEGFAVPIADISEVIKYQEDAIHQVNGQDVIELRGESLPLFYLRDLTRDTTVAQKTNVVELNENQQSRSNTGGFIVVVKDGSYGLGLVVEKLLGQEEAVVKPVTDLFEYHPAISGATITGRGQVHMILDIPYMLKISHRNIEEAA